MAAPLEPGGNLAALSTRSVQACPRLAAAARPVLAVALAGAEVLITSLLFSFEVNVPARQHPAYWVRQVELLATVALVAWGLIAWPRRSEIAALWAASGGPRGWRLPLAVNLALFTALTLATVALSAHAAQAAKAAVPTWGLFWLYCLPLVATGLSMVWLAAPPRFWLGLWRTQRVEIALALTAGVGLLMLGGLAQTGWEPLAGATLQLTHMLLALYESNVHVDLARKAITVRHFTVVIDPSCSGYEGMALVTTFLGIYLRVFRSTLRFPHALALLPIGLAAIFLLNAVRLAALTSIGAHVSPTVAAGGFHSQAGWMAFLAVTIGLMAVAPRIGFIARSPVARRTGPAQRDLTLDAYLAPFMALMAGSIVMAMAAPYDTWVYGLKVGLAALALLLLRAVYRALPRKVSPVAIAAGMMIGIGWIMLEPAASPQASGLAQWLGEQPAGVALAWLALRALGGIIIVPIAEELAFRGMLYRFIISRRFEDVPFDRLSWLALAVSSALFGLMHTRPLAGTLAGAVFALLMVRSGRLADAVAAHVAANAVIIGWAIAARQWSLL